jgi:fucose permease
MMWQKLDDHCHRSQPATLEIRCMKELANTIHKPENQHESTYALLMRSEEKSRNLLEVLIYPFLIIGAIIAIWQFVLQAVELPSMDTKAALRVTSRSGLHPS